MDCGPHNISNISIPAQNGQPMSRDPPTSRRRDSMISIISLIPSAVQNRLPRMASIRKTMCTYSPVDVRVLDRRTNRPSAEHSSKILVRNTQTHPEAKKVVKMEHNQPGAEAGGRRATNQPCLEGRSGIDWKYANQGINLLGLSVEESATIARSPSSGNVSFARQLYLHGVTYLLQGLPSDLSLEEQQALKASIPKALLQPEESETADQSQGKAFARNVSTQPSILHKITATTIVQLFILFQFLLPYLRLLLQSAYEYERTHRISEKVLASSVDVADALGKQSYAITASLYGMRNGKVGEIIGDTTSWLVEGISGGIHDGIREGLSAVRAKEQANEVP